MQGCEPTLLDRLLDDAPLDAVRRHRSIDDVKESVARDLECLLNARTTLFARHDADERPSEAANSVLGYGLGDFASLSLASVHDRAAICKAIARAIAQHEPRLKNAQVLLTVDRRAYNSLHFTIKATLMLRAGEEMVSFDALLHPTRLQYSVSRHASRTRDN